MDASVDEVQHYTDYDHNSGCSLIQKERMDL